MLKTVSRPDFARSIISRYTSAAPGIFPGADMFFISAGEDDGEVSPLARNIQNVRMIHQAITENTVLNLNIQLNFLYSILNKTARELYKSAARHIGMMEKGASMPKAGSPIAGTLLPLRRPYTRQPVPEQGMGRTDPRAADIQSGTLSLVYSAAPEREAERDEDTESPLQFGRKTAAPRDAKSGKPTQPVAQKAGVVTQNQKRGNSSQKLESAPQSAVNPDILLSGRYSPLPLESANIPSLVRKLWRALPAKSAFADRNMLTSLTQPGLLETAAEDGGISVQISKKATAVITVAGFSRIQLQNSGQNDKTEMISPRIPRIFHPITADGSDTRLHEALHTISHEYRPAVQMPPEKREALLSAEKEIDEPLRRKFGNLPANPEKLQGKPYYDVFDGQIVPAKTETLKSGANALSEQRDAASVILPAANKYAQSVSKEPKSAAPATWPGGRKADAGQTAPSQKPLPLKAASRAAVSRKAPEPGINAGETFAGTTVFIPHAAMNHASVTTRRQGTFLETPHVTVGEIPVKPREIFTATAPLAIYTENRARLDHLGAESAPRHNGMRPVPQGLTYAGQQGEAPGTFAAAYGVFAHTAAGTAPVNEAFKAASVKSSANTSHVKAASPLIVMSAPPRINEERSKAPAAAQVPGAAIVYRKEAPARQEQPPVPPNVSRDIEFIKKTVKRTETTARTQNANIAVNLPGHGANATPGRETDIPRDIDRQVNAIADKVYSALERRLRSEQMRKGLL